MFKFLRAVDQIKNSLPECVLTIGNFDGIHLGHQAVLNAVCAKAKECALPAVLMLFEPQPQEFFQQHKAPARLYRLRDKLHYLKNYSLDYVICFRFNQTFANQSAEDFVQNTLVKQLNVKHLFVGTDFRFGHQRHGDIQLLQTMGAQYDFALYQTNTITIHNERVSSSAIRQKLAQGDFIGTKELLGRNYQMTGHVIHGDHLGRELGFPTANIALGRFVSPLWGIYIAQIYGLTETPLPAAVSVGKRPAVGGTKMLVEAHILDFNQQIYGKRLQVEFLQKIRDEQNFDSLDKLVEQIRQDVAKTTKYFK